MRTEDFSYELPTSAIAQEPIEPRDAARLLVCADMSDHSFSELPVLLQPGDLVVVNRTRVRRSRLVGTRRDTGGTVELLLLGHDGHRWSAMARPSRRLRPGIVLEVGDGLEATVMTEPAAGLVEVELGVTGTQPVEEAIEELGEVPLPPYITRELADPERYQTIFAAETSSAAAPTAGLHFTPAVVEGLRSKGIAIAQVHLEVGLDTFRPIATDLVADHEMHSERIEVGYAAAHAIAAALRRGGRIVAIGTTVVRTLEAVARRTGVVEPFRGSTDLFITPGFDFKVVDGLVTNFHLPGTTLIVLVAAFMGEGWREAYAVALAREYRMLSFGDAMMVFR